MMNLWIMDPDIYGMPDYGMTAGQSRVFTQYLGDKGSGRYMSYNPTAPIPVGLVYTWTDTTLAEFRRDWEDSQKLAFGSNWFRLTLPVGFARGDLGGGVYNAHINQPFDAVLNGYKQWKVSLTVDVDASPELNLA